MLHSSFPTLRDLPKYWDPMLLGSFPTHRDLPKYWGVVLRGSFPTLRNIPTVIVGMLCYAVVSQHSDNLYENIPLVEADETFVENLLCSLFSFLFVCIPKKLDVAACVGIHYVPEYHVKLRCIGVVVLGCS